MCAVAYLIVIVVSGRANVSILHMELSHVKRQECLLKLNVFLIFQ